MNTIKMVTLGALVALTGMQCRGAAAESEKNLQKINWENRHNWTPKQKNTIKEYAENNKFFFLNNQGELFMNSNDRTRLFQDNTGPFLLDDPTTLEELKNLFKFIQIHKSLGFHFLIRFDHQLLHEYIT